MPIIIHVAGYGTWFNPSEGSRADLHKLSKKTVGSEAPCVYADCMAHALEIIIYALIDLLCQDRGELPIDPSGFLC
jgi:hypothetical protein